MGNSPIGPTSCPMDVGRIAYGAECLVWGETSHRVNCHVGRKVYKPDARQRCGGSRLQVPGEQSPAVPDPAVTAASTSRQRSTLRHSISCYSEVDGEYCRAASDSDIRARDFNAMYFYWLFVISALCIFTGRPIHSFFLVHPYMLVSCSSHT